MPQTRYQSKAFRSPKSILRNDSPQSVCARRTSESEPPVLRGPSAALPGKLASLEDFISMQNEELAAQRQEIESLRNDKQNIEQHYQVRAGSANGIDSKAVVE